MSLFDCASEFHYILAAALISNCPHNISSVVQQFKPGFSRSAQKIDKAVEKLPKRSSTASKRSKASFFYQFAHREHVKNNNSSYRITGAQCY
ncbi:hypothetical protein TNCV_3724591 [Trichonephila clavipes]|nr:hypothetical protein TNCV_3724591 [Trichonephila clavipes]